MTAATVNDAVARLAAAEQAGDVEALQDLLADDFMLVGPLGFVLDKDQWLEQYRVGNLRYSRFAIQDTQARTYDDVSVVIGVQEQEGDYQGRPVDGRFRVTLILTTAEDRPRIVGMHLSPIATPPAAG